MPDLRYADGIAEAQTLIALEAEASALQRRFPSGWDLAPYAGDDLRGTSLQGANMLVPFHEVYAVRTRDGQLAGLPQLSYIAFVSQARDQATGDLAHLHWFTYTEDPAGFPESTTTARSPRSRGRRPQARSGGARPKSVRSSPWRPSAERYTYHLPMSKGGDLVSWRLPTSRTCRSWPRGIQAS